MTITKMNKTNLANKILSNRKGENTVTNDTDN